MPPHSGREFDLIDWIRTQQRPGPGVILPAGDDLAILQTTPGDLLLVGIDQVLDGVHFDSAVYSPRDIGRKAMNRNLSDCAAMACLPFSAVTSFALRRGTTRDYAQELYAGMKDAAEIYGCAIVGGDTGAWDQPLAISVAILGRSAGIEPVRRSGGKAGDAIYVTGPLGGSILGRHMTFVPRVNEARTLTGQYRISAMIDLSDGLSGDLAHLCRESGVGAVLNADAIPIHPDVQRLPASDISPLQHALQDGEDYELCYTAQPGIPGGHCIGRLVVEPGLWLEKNGTREPLKPRGFGHKF